MMMIATLLARFGLADSVAKKLAPFAAIAAAIALLTALWGAWQVFDYLNDRAAVKQAVLENNVTALEAQVEADATAAAERLRNAATNSETERAYEDAILVPKTDDSDDPGVRLACERLRRAGRDTATVPGCGGR